MATTIENKIKTDGEYFDSVLTYLSALCKNLPKIEAASITPAIHELCQLRRNGMPTLAAGVVYLNC